MQKAQAKTPKIGLRIREEEVQKKARGAVRHHAKKGYAVPACDESSHIIGWNVRNGWYPKGKPVSTAISLSRKRFYSFGALTGSRFYCMFYDRANSTSFGDLLDRLHRKCGKILLFADNASYHKSRAVQKKLREFGGDVVIRHLPPYTPELNPTEGQWRITKKATANTLYGTVDEMKESMRRMMRSGEIKVAKMSGYLTQ